MVSPRRGVRVTSGGEPGGSSPSRRAHDPLVRLQKAGSYRARCTCGWRASATFKSSKAAKQAWSAHLGPDPGLFTSPARPGGKPYLKTRGWPRES